jgi:hypothetical protein
MHNEKKDNVRIIMNTFGTMLNNELKTFPTCVSTIQDLAKFGANAAAKKNVPINLLVAGDILFYNIGIDNIGIGKDGMSGWWGAATANYSRMIGNE